MKFSLRSNAQMARSASRKGTFMRTISVLLSIFLSLQTWAFESHSAEMNNIADMKKRSEIIDEILAQRFEQILPGIMRRSGIDMWVIMSREYNEDPVLKTMLPSTWMSARRHTMLVIYDAGQGKPLEMLAVARYARVCLR